MKDVRSDSTNLKSSCYTSGTVGDVSQFDFPSGLRILWSWIYKHNQQWWHFESHAKYSEKKQNNNFCCISVYSWWSLGTLYLFLHMSYKVFPDTVDGGLLIWESLLRVSQLSNEAASHPGWKGPMPTPWKKGTTCQPIDLQCTQILRTDPIYIYIYLRIRMMDFLADMSFEDYLAQSGPVFLSCLAARCCWTKNACLHLAFGHCSPASRSANRFSRRG